MWASNLKVFVPRIFFWMLHSLVDHDAMNFVLYLLKCTSLQIITNEYLSPKNYNGVALVLWSFLDMATSHIIYSMVHASFASNVEIVVSFNSWHNINLLN